MSKKRSRLPKYEVHEVTDRFERWLKGGNPRGHSPLAGARLQIDGGYDLQKEGLQLKLVAGGIPQIMWFEQDSDVSKDEAAKVLRSFSFHVLSPGLDDGHLRGLKGALAERKKVFEYDEGKRFGEIFGRISYRSHVVLFQDDVYRGLCVDVPIKRIPLGSEKHLSENLFVYAERGIARPARGFVYDLQKG